MKRIKKKKIGILIFLVLIIIIEIIAFSDSRADKTIDTQVIFSEINSTEEQEVGMMSAINGEESGYYIILPEVINDKRVSKYLIIDKEIIKEEPKDENNINETQVEKFPGDKVFLTEEEIENSSITIKVQYDTKKIGETELYKKQIESTQEEKLIKIIGYMPRNAEIKVEKVSIEQVEEIAKEHINANTTIKVAYDIKIVSEGQEYEPTEFDENVEVVITGIDTINQKEENYKVIHIDDENSIEEIENIEINDNKIIFEANQFSTYVVLAETTEKIAIYQSTMASLETNSTWDGQTIATSYTWGSGTEQEPYLISTGEELAYLAQQVNAGTNYEGQYFQLASDINLGDNTWTPIGDIDSSFRGILDGAGHTIANAKITIGAFPNLAYTSYGFFGSIGGGNSRTIIRNIELAGISIEITANGATGSYYNGKGEEGIHIGALAGSMYKNSTISNVIVKDSQITDTNVIDIYNSQVHFSIGGIVGYVTNSSTSDTDPGAASRYIIDNCFSDTTIEIDATAQVSTRGGLFSEARDGRGHYHTGGIVGTICSQPVWPTNSLYRGNISSNGYIGPIFAALINSTDYSSSSGFTAVWNGNDAGNLTADDIYYNSYTANGQSFTQSVISGISTERISDTTTNDGYIQGVNKGIYTTDMNTVLAMFNSNATQDNKYVNWIYEDNTFVFKERLSTRAEKTEASTYKIIVNDPYQVNNYTHRWYENGVENTTIQGDTKIYEANYTADINVVVLTYDGSYYSISNFIVKKIGVDIVFNVNNSTATVVATLEGEGLNYTSVDDYTFQWYKETISGESELIEGGTTLTLTGLEDCMDYRLVATNTVIPQLSTENSFTFGDRVVIYVDYNNGNNNNDGYTETTAVKTLATAYSKLDSNGTRNKNVIVLMGTYNDTSIAFFNSETSTTYAKNATITGKYKNKDYSAVLRFGSRSDYYRFLTADLTLQYLTLNGGSTNNSMYFILQGNDLTVGEQVIMTNYQDANSNQGLIGNENAPAFHVFAGWYQYNERTLPNNDAEILIKSGTYGRVVLGGTPGTSSGLSQTTSRNFMGSSMEDSFRVNVTIDIKNSTTSSNYEYDVNLLVGGSASGNNYSRVTETIKNGKVGRVLGGSIGDSSSIPRNWNYPINTFLGETTINILGGSVAELYGGCLGRNMNVVGSASATGNTCDSYFYGTININISGGEITGNIYGAGAGGVTGYSANSSDPYKSYGQNFTTAVNINLTGGSVTGNIYGGGYGYTEYLNRNVTAADGGALYGNSNIIISGSPTISGNIYAAGCGYNFTNKPNLAQMTGTSNIEIAGTPIIQGQIFGAGQGISGLAEMAKLIGTSNIKIESDLSTEVYGGGNISKTSGTTNIIINSGIHTADIYGGGNLGIVEGNTNVTINDGNQNRIFGGGNQATVTNSNVTMNGGTAQEIYGGGNQATVTTTNVYLKKGTVSTAYGGGNQAGVTTTNIYCQGTEVPNVFGGSNTDGIVSTSNVSVETGNIKNVYGGNNQGGTTENSNVQIKAGVIENVYGGGDQASTTTSNVNSTGGIINNLYGGGNKAGVDTTNITTNGGTIGVVFGGSNQSGNVNQSNVTTNDNSAINQTAGLDMQVTTKVEATSWQSQEYPTIAKITVKFTNSTANDITSWNANIFAPNSVLYTNYSQSEIFENNGLYTLTEQNRYWGNNTITAGGSYTLEFEILSLQSVESFSLGHGISGIDNSGNTVNSTTEFIGTVYGGNNQGGTTTTTNVTINGGNVYDVYGGGNNAVSGETNVTINGKIKNNVFGGGNQAGVNTNTNVKLDGAEVEDNVYGGGNEGTVTRDTNVHVKNSVLNNSLYAGGNGSTAIVYGNTNLIMEGNNTQVANNVFGGGNKAATGSEENDTSISSVNIVGGRIGKNVYGAANTSVVYGVTQMKIGYDAVNNQELEIGNINIGGTVFGGGEANEAGSEVYDFSFISVTQGIDIQINGNKHTEFNIEGSIFGSGNASSTSGESNIYIKKYGTALEPKNNISIQRASLVTLDSSAISLDGTTDRTNEYSSTDFTISRVDEFKLKNSSTVYLKCGANLLKKFSSVVDINGEETKAEVIVDEETGNTTRNVDNRLYLLEGRNLNIAKNEQATDYGEVYGMTFLGLFTNKMSPSTSTGLYNPTYNNGDEITNAGTFVSNSYVKGWHKENHDITIDGFYTNEKYTDDNDTNKIQVEYVPASPDNDVYYIWLVGEELEVTTFEISLTASKYATLGTYELSLVGFAKPNIEFILSGFSAGLDSGISLVKPEDIKAIENDETIANNVYGLTMESGNNAWQNKNKTLFLTENGGKYEGSSKYLSDNSTSTPTLNFCLYHAQNLSEEKDLGEVNIRFQVMTPIDDLNYKLSYMDIIISLDTALYQDDYYEAAITPGERFGLFTSTETSISNSSKLSTYYSLYINNFDENKHYAHYQNYKRVLVSRDETQNPKVLPRNTKITLLDMVTNRFYYYVITQADENNNKYEYYIEDFIAMGSTNEKFDEDNISEFYYDIDNNLIYENFIFHIDFGETNIEQNMINNSLLMELRDENGEVHIGVLGIQRDVMFYNVYLNSDATIDVTATIEPTVLYLGHDCDLTVTTDLKQSIVDSKTIYDTKHFNNKMGIKITFYDSNGNRVNRDTLFGARFILDGKSYYPSIDGTTRICIADKVSNVLSRIKFDTSNNTSLATGDYIIKIESFGSSDGIYYGLESSDEIELQIKIINFSYGIKVYTDDKSKIIRKDTGYTLNENNLITVDLEYSSGLSSPSIAVSLYRRNYDEIYSQEYELVDLADYISNFLTPTTREKEYMVLEAPTGDVKLKEFLQLKNNLKTGTYRIVYKLYDEDILIGEAYEYIIIK